MKINYAERLIDINSAERSEVTKLLFAINVSVNNIKIGWVRNTRLAYVSRKYSR